MLVQYNSECDRIKLLTAIKDKWNEFITSFHEKKNPFIIIKQVSNSVEDTEALKEQDSEIVFKIRAISSWKSLAHTENIQRKEACYTASPPKHS